jgi:prolyl 4-hydroxylase
VGILRKNGFADVSIQQALASLVTTSQSLTGKSDAPQVIDIAWQNWLRENVQRGCDPEQLLQTLLDHGFSEASIVQTLTEMSKRAEAEGTAEGEPRLDYDAIANPSLLRRPPATLQPIEPEVLQLFTLDDFLSDAECDAIVAITNRHLRPSTVTVENGDKYYRTSRTCDLSLIKDPQVAALDLKIALTLGIRPAYSEGIQAQRYDVGQEFKRHTDYFEPGTPEYARFAAERGNRTWTFMVYLNDGMEGGGTRFFAIDRVFQPKKGQAVIWNNLYRDGTPNPDTLHSGEPVTAGHKIIITKWFRENGSGEMFFE